MFLIRFTNLLTGLAPAVSVRRRSAAREYLPTRDPMKPVASSSSCRRRNSTETTVRTSCDTSDKAILGPACRCRGGFENKAGPGRHYRVPNCLRDPDFSDRLSIGPSNLHVRLAEERHSVRVRASKSCPSLQPYAD